MKLVRLNATPFATALNELLGTLIAAHPDSQQILDDVTAGRLSLRIIVDQAQNRLTIGATQQDGEQRVVAGVDMSAGSSSWQVVYPDWNAEPPPIDAVLH